MFSIMRIKKSYKTHSQKIYDIFDIYNRECVNICIILCNIQVIRSSGQIVYAIGMSSLLTFYYCIKTR